MDHASQPCALEPDRANRIKSVFFFQIGNQITANQCFFFFSGQDNYRAS